MDRDSVYLLDIVSSARMLRSYLEGVVLDEFLRDEIAGLGYSPA